MISVFAPGIESDCVFISFISFLHLLLPLYVCVCVCVSTLVHPIAYNCLSQMVNKCFFCVLLLLFEIINWTYITNQKSLLQFFAFIFILISISFSLSLSLSLSLSYIPSWLVCQESNLNKLTHTTKTKWSHWWFSSVLAVLAISMAKLLLLIVDGVVAFSITIIICHYMPHHTQTKLSNPIQSKSAGHSLWFFVVAFA